MSSPLTVEGPQPAPRFACYQLEPLHDPRWAQLVERHPKASVFHTVGWLQTLRHTYGYEPVAFTTSPPTGELKNGVVFCRIDSRLTGRRLVSLPFSDHCEPLCDSPADLHFLIRYLQTAMEHQEWKYLQLRPRNGKLDEVGDGHGWVCAQEFFFHALDLRPDLETVFRGLNKDSVQRRIQRAERAGLLEKSGNSEELLRDFYALFLKTRRRQGVPPTPYAWFHNLVVNLKEGLEIRVAYKEQYPIAAIVTLHFQDTVYYKYGSSDARFNKYGATPWLFWKAITCAKSRGATQFDLGRTEKDNAGLVAFKNQWVPTPEELVYWQYPYAPNRVRAGNWKRKAAKSAFSLLPGGLQVMIGKLLYPHIG
jgi:hypothetical protein